MEDLTPQEPKDEGYRVLALKYRPRRFDDLVGQDAMVRTLRAAFATGRVAHAFMLTGVRGVGKTTTARLLARAFNYTDAEGKPAPGVDFREAGTNCRAILDGTHMDVLEMDAASRTSIDDIREIIDSAKFKPAIAAYKVYIIDEVHMLSKSAFNGLLKILEEPPPHVKFIFATTEIRKVPVTILSRCQRFDLRRIETDVMIAHLKGICEREKVNLEEGALALVARASEGSVRDALSLLDQALAQGAATCAPIDEALVRDMLGLADRERVLDLLDLLFQGKAPEALGELKAQYDLGADPLEVLRDLLDLVNWLTRIKLVGEAAIDAGVPAGQAERGRAMAGKLELPVLSRAWQMLLKGLGEAQTAPRALAAAEMVLVRLAYAAHLPSPDEVIRILQKGDGPKGADTLPRPQPPRAQTSERTSPANEARLSPGPVSPTSQPQPQSVSGPEPSLAAPEAWAEPAPDYARETAPDLASDAVPELLSFADLLAFVADKRDLRLLHDLEDYVHLVRFEPGRMEFRPALGAPEGLPGRLSQNLEKWTGRRWGIVVSGEPGAPTIAQQNDEALKQLEQNLREDPLVKAVFDAFPEASVVAVRPAPTPDETAGAIGAANDDILDASPANAGRERN